VYILIIAHHTYFEKVVDSINHKNIMKLYFSGKIQAHKLSIHINRTKDISIDLDI
jgi:hypothetical protein